MTLTAWINEQRTMRGICSTCYAIVIRFDDSGVDVKMKKSSLGDRPMVGLQILDLPIGVRVPVSQPIFLDR
jgi:hypothetical protein